MGHFPCITLYFLPVRVTIDEDDDPMCRTRGRPHVEDKRTTPRGGQEDDFEDDQVTGDEGEKRRARGGTNQAHSIYCRRRRKR
ncbi:hypothetical protein Pcinc_033588 [Petrolisthes cinctipes]|uniref:Uncharacterized protein n=1 Tax=Petrolisthes cinctipes TaxID=88211 RepID=A0AAE1ES41_PETCI|nr:hypothetical protein Pcinc_033588 [Petrolisthes cinctipes]